MHFFWTTGGCRIDVRVACYQLWELRVVRRLEVV